MGKWADLNERQQFYLEAIFDEDQRTEANFRRLKAKGLDNTPAHVWRWMPYNAQGEVLQKKFEANGMKDEGTGSTLRALETRGLILLRYTPGSIREPIIWIQITRVGRALVRKAFDLEAPKSLPIGTLQEWHWRALVCVYQAQHADFVEFPRGIGNSTIRRLEDYKVKGEEKPLITWTEIPCDPWIAQDWHHKPYTRTTRNVQRLTPFGQQYYKENWARYRELYPNVDAPKPTEEQQ